MSNELAAESGQQTAESVADPNRFEKFFIKVSDETGLPVDPPPVVEKPLVMPAAQQPPAGQSPAGQPDLAAKIRADREARATKATQETEAKGYKERAEKAEAQLAAMGKKDMIADTVGWAEAQQLTPEERAIMGETLLYSLVPDKATPEVRIKMMEARQARQAKLNETKVEQAAREAQEASVMKTHQDYVDTLSVAAKSLSPGTFPDSEAWFGGDHQSYVQSLYATANNLAEAARAEGKVADLTIGAVAKVLEADLTTRYERRAPRKPAEAPQVQEQNSKDVGKQADDKVMSTKGMGGGPPRPPAKTDEERIARAAEALWRSK